MRPVFVAILGFIVACSAASDSTESQRIGRFSLDADSFQQWKLPKKLREISGLALTPDDRLFAIGDEQGIVYELDYNRGNIVKTFGLGSPIARDDFEGIAYLNDLIYIVSSAGRLYELAEGSDGEHVNFKAYRTGLGGICEIEGLAPDIQSGTLHLACKRNRSASKLGNLSIFAWSPSTGELLPDRQVEIPTMEIARKLGKKRVSPSAIAIDPETGNYYGLAGPQRAIFELTPSGGLIDAIILPLADRHRQAEGIEITRDGKLLIADEGGKKKARLGVYASQRVKTTEQQD